MLKFCARFTLVMLSVALFSSTASAVQLNVTLGSEIMKNQDKINIKYEIITKNGKYNCEKESEVHEGIYFLYFPQLMGYVKQNLLSVHPLTGSGSKISLGYVKNNNSVYPASCSDIPFTEVMNIILDESGCTVS